MANPSLQIGNSNWAIKKDNLLGYSSSGTRFFPIPITMTRASAGTRVNPQGLVETVELLGSEEIVNGDFATDSDWVKGAGWTISGGNANSDGSGTAFLYQIISNVQTKRFLIEYEVKNYVSGSVSIVLGSAGSDQLTSSSNGVTSGIVVWDGTSDRLNFKSTSLNGSIDNVSVKEYQANDLARVDYTGSTSSLLAEPQRTNLVTYSEDFSQSAWQKSNITATPNSIISPDGTLNAYKLTKPTSSAPRLFELSVYPSTGVHTFTSFYKNLDGDSVLIRLDGGGNTANCEVDLTTNTLVNSGANIISSNITQLSDGWIRVSITANILSTSWILDAANLFSISISSSVYIWGAQLEEGSYATSYIPTNGEAGGVTRVQDQYSKTGISDKINSEEGVLFLELNPLHLNATNRYITIFDSTNVLNKIHIKFETNLNIQVRYYVNNVVSFTATYVQSDFTNIKIALKWKVSDFALWINGNEEASQLSGAVNATSTFDTLSLAYTSGSLNFYGKAKQLQVYKTTDIDLAALTS